MESDNEFACGDIAAGPAPATISLPYHWSKGLNQRMLDAGVKLILLSAEKGVVADYSRGPNAKGDAKVAEDTYYEGLELLRSRDTLIREETIADMQFEAKRKAKRSVRRKPAAKRKR